MKDYHNDYEYLSKSFLTKFELSPAHAYHYMTSDKTDSEAMCFGRVYHAMIAGQTDEFIVFDPENRPELDKTFGSKLNKQWKDDFYKSADVDIVSIDDYNQISFMITKLQNNDIVQQINAFSLVQEEAFRAVVDTYKIKCKPDGLQLARGAKKENLIIDWKTCQSIHPDKIRYDIVKYGYDVQAAMYSEIISAIHSHESNFMFIFQEKSEPYDVLPVLVTHDSTTMREGKNKWRNYYIQARECFEKNSWPGVANRYDAKCLILD